jgi:hypothetical protein
MDLEAIWRRARADLVMTTSRGDSDVFLWEHSSRVAKSAQSIAELPEVRVASPDPLAVVAAALYHDAGWVTRWKNGEIERTEVLLATVTEATREQGALMLERSLAGHLPQESLTRASRAVRLLSERELDSIDAQVVAEAENLEEFGVLSLWQAVRRGTREGKGVRAVLDTWRRKREYQFWSARLSDSFRFDSVRELAAERLSRLERLMEELEDQQLGRDVTALLARGTVDEPVS